MQILYTRKYVRSHIFYCYVQILADPEVRLRHFMRTVHSRYVRIYDIDRRSDRQNDRNSGSGAPQRIETVDIVLC